MALLDGFFHAVFVVVLHETVSMLQVDASDSTVWTKVVLDVLLGALRGVEMSDEDSGADVLLVHAAGGVVLPPLRAAASSPALAGPGAGAASSRLAFVGVETVAEGVAFPLWWGGVLFLVGWFVLFCPAFGGVVVGILGLLSGLFLVGRDAVLLGNAVFLGCLGLAVSWGYCWCGLDGGVVGAGPNLCPELSFWLLAGVVKRAAVQGLFLLHFFGFSLSSGAPTGLLNELKTQFFQEA